MVVPSLFSEACPGCWVVVLTNVPQVAPVGQALVHALVGFNVSVRPFPRHFTAFEAAEEPFEAFSMALGEPGLVLEMQLIIGCLLCFVLLVLHGMVNQVSCVLIFVGMPMMTGV